MAPLSSKTAPSITAPYTPSVTFFNGHSAATILPPSPSSSPSPRPPAYAARDCDEIIRLILALPPSPSFRLVAEIPFEGASPHYEPEGIVRVGPDRYYVSLGEYPERPRKHSPDGTVLDAEGYDRTPGAGLARLVVFDAGGRRVADAALTSPGDAEYHTGGLEYDGTHVWATLSEYRPDSTATLVRIDPATLAVTPVLRVADHAGGVVCDPATGDVTTLSWGARFAHSWKNPQTDPPRPLSEFSTPRAVVRNPSAWIDYQDAKFLGRSSSALLGGRPVMLASGVGDLGGSAADDSHKSAGLLQPKVRVGGIALVDCETMTPLAEVPVPLLTRRGAHMCKNPVDVAVEDGRLRLYFLPDEAEATLYVWEVGP